MDLRHLVGRPLQQDQCQADKPSAPSLLWLSVLHLMWYRVLQQVFGLRKEKLWNPGKNMKNW